MARRGNGMRSLVLGVALALCPMQAWAECAWVLWETTQELSDAGTPAADITVSPFAAFASLKECDHDRALQRQIKFTKVRSLFTCLPDTVDPRGPKAGGR
jgi:hypothetical protein